MIMQISALRNSNRASSAEVDNLAMKVAALESAVHSVTKLEEKEFIVLTELLMLQLLKLDGVVAEGEAKVRRRVEVGA
ncbi:hypothetical protein Scep_012751 [Stephania cephalantha]|uniref:BAG domain-containing protein n=1 Tax=Stephania cephalantha TaxID=152367 RepID=A0AAP0P6Z2_9MAGN